MYLYTLSNNPSKLYLWDVEDIPINECFPDIKQPLTWCFEELTNYPSKNVVYARALQIRPPRRNILITECEHFEGRLYIPLNYGDLGVIVIEKDNWYKARKDKPIKTFYVRKEDRNVFSYFDKEGMLNDYIKYEYRGN